MNYTVVDPTSVIGTHLTETVKAHAAELLTREEVANLVEGLKQRSPKLVEEAIPAVVKLGDLHKVLAGLMRERVPVRDIDTIVETLAEWGGKTKDTDVLIEYVRNALRRTISHQHASPGDTPGKLRIVCVTLDPALEDEINGYVDRGPAGTTVSMPARVATRITGAIARALQQVTAAGHPPVILASPTVRSVVRQLLEPGLPTVVVLGYNEIVHGIEVESLALVTAEREQAVEPRYAAGSAA
jgi:flagellar biosynthesis protein FlhA